MKTLTRFTISQAIESVASYISADSDQSTTTIRCALNDALEHAERDGFTVNHGYDQPRAVARVKAILRSSGRTLAT